MEKNLKNKFMNSLIAILYTLNGRFGSRRLKRQFLLPYRFIVWGGLIFLIFIYILQPIDKWLNGIVALINYVYWGML